MQFFKNRICGGGSFERRAIFVVRGNEMVDALHELADAGEGGASDGLGGNEQEEALDLIAPGSIGWSEMQAPAEATIQWDDAYAKRCAA